MCAAEHDIVRFHAVTNDVITAVGANGSHGMDRTLEGIEYVSLSVRVNQGKGLVVVVATRVAAHRWHLLVKN
jgi:hypothetical protein